MHYPKITIAVPTFNEAKNLEICLKAISSQKYPKDRIEVVVVDNYSSDETLLVAKKYQTSVYFNKIKDAQVSKMIAFNKSQGEYFIYLDADIEIQGDDWFIKMLKPFQGDSEIVASFTKFIVKKADNGLVRYLSYDTLQRDPIFEFASPSVESLIREKKKDYSVCYYGKDKIPPSGVCLYKKQYLTKILDKETKKFMELDVLSKLVKAGYYKFAYVPGAGIHHPFLKNITQLVKKRLRNLKRNYIGQESGREYKWFDLSKPKGFLKALVWVVYANTIILPTFRGIYKSIKHRDLACMYEPIVSFIETWVVIYGLFVYSFKKNISKLPQGN
jgi:glycosyltransferase involved in cell wall biosynthesis